jgi:hypothetical protein
MSATEKVNIGLDETRRLALWIRWRVRAPRAAQMTTAAISV